VVSFACTPGISAATLWLPPGSGNPSGAIAFWGSHDLAHWEEGRFDAAPVYDAYFNEGSGVLSELTTAGLEEVCVYFGGKNLSRYYWETYNTFGDPRRRCATGRWLRCR